MIYEIICREVPFEEEEPADVGKYTLAGVRPDMDAVPPDTPPEIAPRAPERRTTKTRRNKDVDTGKVCVSRSDTTNRIPIKHHPPISPLAELKFELETERRVPDGSPKRATPLKDYFFPIRFHVPR